MERKKLSSQEVLITLMVIVSIGVSVGYGITFATGTLMLFSLGLMTWAILRRLRVKHTACNVLYIFVSIGMIIWGLTFLVIQTLILTSVSYDLDHNDYDYIIVLGAGINGEKLSLILEQRLELAVELSNRLENAKVIVSGGQGPGEDITEAKAMSRYLVENGIEEDRILLEEVSTSTAENFMYSKIIFDEVSEENDNVLVITNEFHMFRSLKLAKRYGFNAQGIACRTPIIIRLNYLSREYLAVIKSIILD